MAYEPQSWADGEAGGTPLSAERLNHLEQGVAQVESDLGDALEAKADAPVGTWKIPGRDGTGLVELSYQASMSGAYTIVQRDEAGAIVAAEPTLPEHLATKAYVDAAIAAALNASPG